MAQYQPERELKIQQIQLLTSRKQPFCQNVIFGRKHICHSGPVCLSGNE